MCRCCRTVPAPADAPSESAASLGQTRRRRMREELEAIRPVQRRSAPIRQERVIGGRQLPTRRHHHSETKSAASSPGTDCCYWCSTASRGDSPFPREVIEVQRRLVCERVAVQAERVGDQAARGPAGRLSLPPGTFSVPLPIAAVLVKSSCTSIKGSPIPAAHRSRSSCRCHQQCDTSDSCSYCQRCGCIAPNQSRGEPGLPPRPSHGQYET